MKIYEFIEKYKPRVTYHHKVDPQDTYDAVIALAQAVKEDLEILRKEIENVSNNSNADDSSN